MTHSAALPFTIRRDAGVIKGREITSTHETVHGLLRLDGERVVIQWRVSRATDRVGKEIRTDHEVEPVKEVVLPLSALADAEVRHSRWRWPLREHLVLTAADLLAFEKLAGMEGLQLKHPAELVIRIARSSHMAALEFASEVQLALADRALREADQAERLAGDSRAQTHRLGPPT